MESTEHEKIERFGLSSANRKCSIEKKKMKRIDYEIKNPRKHPIM
jgi:hypothetical protein